MRTVEEVQKRLIDEYKEKGETMTMYGLCIKDWDREALLGVIGYLGAERQREEEWRRKCADIKRDVAEIIRNAN